jgi:hypothetical protein
MKFAKIIWDCRDLGAAHHPARIQVRSHRPPAPAITHPGFFNGFVGAALAWQVAFSFIATDPFRYRSLILPSILEKASYSITVVVLFLQARIHASDLVFVGTHGLLGILFLVAYLKAAPAAKAL